MRTSNRGLVAALCLSVSTVPTLADTLGNANALFDYAENTYPELLSPAGPDNPGGDYDGTYVDDYEYVQGSGDLDECNGMMRNGSYGYYVVNEYPWVLACYQGTPHASFEKSGEGGGSNPGVPGGMGPPPG